MSREIRRLLLDLDPYGGTDSLGMFPLFLKRTAAVLWPRLSVVFRRLVRLGSFLACWRQANVPTMPKGPPSSSVDNYRPNFMTSVCLGRYMERSGGLPTTQFPYLKGLGACDALCATIHCKVHWRVGSRLGSCRLISNSNLIVCAAFRLCSVGIGV